MPAPAAGATATERDGGAGAAAVWVLGGLSVFYAALAVVHTVVLTGAARTVMAPAAAASAALLAAAATVVRRRGGTVSPTVEAVGAVPVLNCLLHLVVSGELHQTTTLMLALVGVAAAVTNMWIAAAVDLLGCLGWVAAVALRPELRTPELGHFGFQLAMAVAFAALLHGAIARREADLRTARDALRDSERNLAAVAAVARRIRTGEDPRTSIITALRHLAAADTAVLVEPATATGPNAENAAVPARPHAGDLVITAAADERLVGTRIPLSVTSATVHVYRNAQPVLLADPADGPPAAPHLPEMTPARSKLWQPVVADGRCTAVLAVTWNRRVAALGDQRAQAVALLADEAALALAHDHLLRQLEAQAHTDSLTGLPNRRAWHAALTRLLTEARRTGRPLTIAIADMDHFKRYNDTHGHPAGDDLLRETAQAFAAVTRGSDLVARWGGEEFAFAFVDCPPASAPHVLQRVRQAVPRGQTCSVGYAVWDTVETADTLLSRADAALYTAKASGRNTVTAGTAPPH